MAEIKKVWTVRDPDESVLDDPAIRNEAERLDQVLIEMDVDTLASVIRGTPGNLWWAEHTKLYDDEASARKDAEKRLAQLRKRLKKTAERVAARFAR